MHTPVRVFTDWLAWGRRSPANKVLFSITVGLAAAVTGGYLWAMLDPRPGDFARYFALYWTWGLCAVAILLAMAEWKTGPLRKHRETGHLWLLLYIGALLIVTRALNMVLYFGGLQ